VIVYRIARKEHIGDLTGLGARLYGGRWNPKGVGVVYTSGSRALAALELYANRSRVASLKGLSVASIAIPDDAPVHIIDPTELPPDWMAYPAPGRLQEIGARWARARESLVLGVPSALVWKEWNYLINPVHERAAEVRVVEAEEFAFDQRLG
jgi:RES domain-containing protein